MQSPEFRTGRNNITDHQDKKILTHIFIDGLSGMAGGLFATLIAGILKKIVHEKKNCSNTGIKYTV